MLEILLVIMLIISLVKPESILSKKIKERANDEQKAILANNTRKIFPFVFVGFELTVGSLSRIISISETVKIILMIIWLICVFVIIWPIAKESSKIRKELNK